MCILLGALCVCVSILPRGIWARKAVLHQHCLIKWSSELRVKLGMVDLRRPVAKTKHTLIAKLGTEPSGTSLCLVLDKFRPFVPLLLQTGHRSP